MFVKPFPRVRNYYERCSTLVYFSCGAQLMDISPIPHTPPSERRTVPRPEHLTKYLHYLKNVSSTSPHTSVVPTRHRRQHWQQNDCIYIDRHPLHRLLEVNHEHQTNISDTSSEYRILVCNSLDNDMLLNREAWLTSSRSICELTNFIPNLEINCMSLNTQTLVLGNYTDDERNTDLRYQYDKTGSKQDAAALSQITWRTATVHYYHQHHNKARYWLH